jgi:nicotinate phosphoribosyltransferase
VEAEDGQLVFDICGSWAEVTLWETIILSIVNELYYRSILKKMSPKQRKALFSKGERRLRRKIEILRTYPGIKFSDFGTRRRFSRAWQEHVVATLARELPGQFMGTSNVHLAMKYDITPIGTFAHELYMVFSGIFRGGLRASHNKVLKYWWNLYGEQLSVALTDTYGTDFFFEDMTEDQARKWRGLRHDSGDPIEFGEKAIRFYEKFGIDPKTKILVFSDGLDLETIIKIYEHFKGRINMAFGWGTNLTNDFGLLTLSLIVKAIEAAGHGTVKLSDNLAKAMGSQQNIELFRITFGHSVTFRKECRY